MRILALLLAACRGYQTPLAPNDTDAPDGATDPVASTSSSTSTTPWLDTAVTETTPGPTSDGCRYPARPVEPMAKGEVLTPYVWRTAQRMDGLRASLELGKVPCDTDDDIDWSPFDVLVFISIPAW